METVCKWLLAAGSAAASYLFGGWSGVLGVLLVFVILDYLTGIAAAAVEGKLKSKIGDCMQGIYFYDDSRRTLG